MVRLFSAVRNKSLSTNSVSLHATYVEVKMKYVINDVALRIIIDVYYGVKSGFH